MTAKKQNPGSDTVAPNGDKKPRAVAAVSLLGQHNGVLDDEVYELLVSDVKDFQSR